MARENSYKGRRNSVIEVNLNTPEKKKTLVQIAYWKGYGSTNELIRRLLFKFIEETPENFKKPIPED